MTSNSSEPASDAFADDMVRASARIYTGIVDWYVTSFFDDRSDDDWLDLFVARLSHDPLVADVGSGPGNFGCYLRSKGCRVVSSDVSFGMARAALRYVERSPAIVDDMRRLSLRNESVDALLCAYSMMHLPAPHDASALDEFCRVVRPNGWLQIMVKTGKGGHAFRAHTVPGVSGHVQLFDREKLAGALEATGFEVLDMRTKPATSPHEFDHPKLMLLSRRKP